MKTNKKKEKNLKKILILVVALIIGLAGLRSVEWTGGRIAEACGGQPCTPTPIPTQRSTRTPTTPVPLTTTPTKTSTPPATQVPPTVTATPMPLTFCENGLRVTKTWNGQYISAVIDPACSLIGVPPTPMGLPPGQWVVQQTCTGTIQYHTGIGPSSVRRLDDLVPAYCRPAVSVQAAATAAPTIQDCCTSVNPINYFPVDPVVRPPSAGDAGLKSRRFIFDW